MYNNSLDDNGFTFKDLEQKIYKSLHLNIIKIRLI